MDSWLANLTLVARVLDPCSVIQEISEKSMVSGRGGASPPWPREGRRCARAASVGALEPLVLSLGGLLPPRTGGGLFVDRARWPRCQLELARLGSAWLGSIWLGSPQFA